ncbi:pentatricopeptide repeat-containing protein 1, mitochondrial [Fopius arisanus]|uniref:PTCD1 protein n=1 Tax=Fopius arisanus TaxID=64838 RepID=A0A0C9QSZ9_9HYME|nr:PREDICTED: pentatricopeptide repeat-containing protein 1, mitochondrial [Fopius arisanus]
MLLIRLNRLKKCLKFVSVVKSFDNSRQLSQMVEKQLPYNYRRYYSTEKFASVNPEIFGDIGGNKFEESPLDYDEEKQQDFEKNEAAVAPRLKLSKGQYADLIKEHITKGDLTSAMEVLDLVKENRDQPTRYMYTLLLRAFAVQGNLKRSWKILTAMKKRALKPNSAAYVSIINACANSSERTIALDYLERIREEILLKNVVLNEVHYNALVKAYGRHNCLLEAFKIVDEMIDKRLTIGPTTFNSLLYACISDKENGLRHALAVWHMMQRWKKKPDLLTYNLLLRAIRDTKMGELKTNDILLNNYEGSRILISDSLNPDLLSHPPVVSKIKLSFKHTEQPEMSSRAASDAVVAMENHEALENFNLEKIHEKNKLILFGGFTGFMQRLQADDIKPDVKTMTLLLDVVPNSLAIENELIKTARANKIPLDIDFFNMLIKKRSFRKDYKQAKQVLDDIQRENLVPDMITWGVLALGCHTLEEATVFLNGLEATGHSLNPVIAGSLLGNACCANKINYILEILRLMTIQRIFPTNHIYTILDKYKFKVEDALKRNRSSKLYRNDQFRTKFETFKNRYEKFQQKFRRETNHEHIRKRKIQSLKTIP